VDYFDRLKEIAESEGVADRLIWTDSIHDAGAMMNAIDVLAHACDLEGFGRVAIEAMCAGKPVVGPNVGGFAESVVDGETGRSVPPGDPVALADGIVELVGDAAAARGDSSVASTQMPSIQKPVRERVATAAAHSAHTSSRFE
jgi:glycosyltransferase involved in cell wall biosynthesis